MEFAKKTTSSSYDLFDDKKFIVKFVALSIAIVVLSVLGIMQEESKISFNSSIFKSIKLESLSQIEKNLNGNGIDLDVVEDDFATLSELDLSDIVLSAKEQTTHIKQNKVHSITKNPKIVIDKTSSKKQNKKIIITSGSIKSLSFIKKRFYATHNINFALKIADRFYDAKRYKKSLKWALIANEINDKNENSWIIFAKSKVKLGKKGDAINALKEYLKHNRSANVKSLLDDILKNS